jgi:hypothetical protein
MIHTLQTRRPPRLLAWALAALMGGPLMAGLAGCGSKDTSTAPTVSSSDTAPPAPSAAPGASAMSGQPVQPQAKQGMSTRNKVIILAGAALLYYLYKKHQAAQQAQAGTQGSGAQPQLYRSSNGGVYYRDPQNPQKVTWLTVPNQPVQVPESDVQQYAPDYQKYQGQPAPAVPAGQASQPVTQYDPSLAGS